jgi:hypothetical protein
MLFYDRITDGTKYLVDQFLKNGKWTFYEPNIARNYSTWVNNICSCHILMFLGDKISRTFYSNLIEDLNNQKHNTKIVIVAYSNHGYSYSIERGNKMTKFKDITHFDKIADISKGDDVLTAGFIDKLMHECKTPTDEIDEQAVIEALSFGHSLAKDAYDGVGCLGALHLFNNTSLADMIACDFCKSLQLKTCS